LCVNDDFFKDLTRANALAKSLQKWEAIVEFEEMGFHITNDGGSDTCACCALYVLQDCKDCPIALETGSAFCHGTPYADWAIEPTREAAQAEVEFLKFLLDLMEEAGDGGAEA